MSQESGVESKRLLRFFRGKNGPMSVKELQRTLKSLYIIIRFQKERARKKEKVRASRRGNLPENRESREMQKQAVRKGEKTAPPARNRHVPANTHPLEGEKPFSGEVPGTPSTKAPDFAAPCPREPAAPFGGGITGSLSEIFKSAALAQKSPELSASHGRNGGEEQAPGKREPFSGEKKPQKPKDPKIPEHPPAEPVYGFEIRESARKEVPGSGPAFAFSLPN
ncbi:uncharacterized protein NEMAJ01_0607 [Nematocida major]|uniref:uncharacterized protein n=1 Tax=Nematocida major TaxID=1912982 RepID=UPI002007B442|nr:uncharacterized protein NEMAJ01_0607 [Nematocida major]KAH9385711.1 hypothetical protein NEMAJ01_0607 [Nematocida major]